MSKELRFKLAAIASLTHLLISAVLAVAVACLVFIVWYPHPYGEIAGGQGLFLLVVVVDMVCGPLLTLVIFEPRKPRTELIRDILLVVLIQLTALGYGLHSLALARPVWLAFEGDRFRVVSQPDIADQDLKEAPEALRRLSWTGPKLLGVRLISNSDPAFLESVQSALAGLHPSFRPSRWVPYETQLADVQAALRPMARLFERHPQETGTIRNAVPDAPFDTLGYLPLVTDTATNWVALVRRLDGLPVAYLPLDGFE